MNSFAQLLDIAPGWQAIGIQDDVAVIVAGVRIAADNAIGFAFLLEDVGGLSAAYTNLEQFAVNFRVQQAHDLALVVGHIERDVPAEVIVAHRCDGQQQFHALIGQFPYVDHLGAKAGGAGNTSVEDVVFRFAVVVGEVHSNAVVKHAQVEAEFDLGIRQRGKRCIGNLAGSDAAQRLAQVALAEQPVGQQQLVRVGVAAHLCPGSTQFSKSDRLRQPNRVGEHKTQAH